MMNPIDKLSPKMIAIEKVLARKNCLTEGSPGSLIASFDLGFDSAIAYLCRSIPGKCFCGCHTSQICQPEKTSK